MRVHICQFDSTTDIKKPTYEKIKQRVLEAGRFSVFEATASPRMAAIFTQIERAPDIETFELQFPWRGIRLKETKR